jgi:hypothetical protein
MINYIPIQLLVTEKKTKQGHFIQQIDYDGYHVWEKWFNDN